MKKIVLPLALLTFFVLTELVVLNWNSFSAKNSIAQILIIIVIPIIMTILFRELNWRTDKNALNRYIVIGFIISILVLKGCVLLYRDTKITEVIEMCDTIQRIEVNTINEAMDVLSKGGIDKYEKEINKFSPNKYKNSLYSDWKAPYNDLNINIRKNLFALGEEYGFDKNINKQIKENYKTFDNNVENLNAYIDNEATILDMTVWKFYESDISRNSDILTLITVYQAGMGFAIYKLLQDRRSKKREPQNEENEEQDKKD